MLGSTSKSAFDCRFMSTRPSESANFYSEFTPIYPSSREACPEPPPRPRQHEAGQLSFTRRIQLMLKGGQARMAPS